MTISEYIATTVLIALIILYAKLRNNEVDNNSSSKEIESSNTNYIKGYTKTIKPHDYSHDSFPNFYIDVNRYIYIDYHNKLKPTLFDLNIRDFTGVGILLFMNYDNGILNILSSIVREPAHLPTMWQEIRNGNGIRRYKDIIIEELPITSEMLKDPDEVKRLLSFPDAIINNSKHRYLTHKDEAMVYNTLKLYIEKILFSIVDIENKKIRLNVIDVLINIEFTTMNSLVFNSKGIFRGERWGNHDDNACILERVESFIRNKNLNTKIQYFSFDEERKINDGLDVVCNLSFVVTKIKIDKQWNVYKIFGDSIPEKEDQPRFKNIKLYSNGYNSGADIKVGDVVIVKGIIYNNGKIRVIQSDYILCNHEKPRQVLNKGV